MFTLQMFMGHSMGMTKSSEDMSLVLSLLSELAFNGLVHHGSNGLPRLAFDKSDFNDLKERALPGILI